MKLRHVLCIVCCVLLSFFSIELIVGQTLTAKKRTYANFQGSLVSGTSLLGGGLVKGSIVNAGNAVSGNPKDFSTLGVGIGLLGLASVTQFLEFRSNGSSDTVRDIATGTPVTIKFTLPQSVLGVLDGISVGYYSNLSTINASWPLIGAGNDAGYKASSMTEVSTGAALLNLLSGAGNMELTFTPSSIYQGVYVKLSGNALALALTNNLYHAFILENGSVSCEDRDKSIDVLHGVRTTAGLALANATGTVVNPWATVDKTGTTVLQLGTQVLSQVFHTTVFNTVSKPNQIAKIVLQNPGGGLLNLNLLTGLSIQPYLGSEPVDGPINSSSVLSLRLLPGPEGKNELTVPISGAFDRIEIKLGGVAGAVGTLNIYEVSRTIGSFLYPDSELKERMTACGEVDLIDALLNYQPSHYNYRFYNSVDGAVDLGNSKVKQSGRYFVEVIDNETGCFSERVAVDVVVLPIPGKPHLTITNILE